MNKPMLYIKEVTGKGRGVFSSTPIEKHDLIEECPMIILPPTDLENITRTSIIDYCFFLDKERSTIGVALGLGSIYNHSVHCNAHHMIDPDTRTITFFALKDIREHEEITINYTGDPDNLSTTWFETRNMTYHP